MAFDQNISALGGSSIEDLTNMSSDEFEALLNEQMQGLDDDAKAEKYQDIKEELEDTGEIIDAQIFQLQDIYDAAKKEGDTATMEKSLQLIEELEKMNEFIEDFSSNWGEVEQGISEHNQSMTATGFQFFYSSMDVKSGDVYNIDATSLGSPEGIFGDSTSSGETEKAYLVLNLNPGDTLGEPVLDTSSSPVTLTIPVISEDGTATRYIKISAQSLDAMPEIKLAGGTGGLTEEALEQWPSSVLKLFYESTSAEHNFNYYVNGSDTGIGGRLGNGKLGGKLKQGPLQNLGNLGNLNILGSSDAATKVKKIDTSKIKITDTLSIGSIAGSRIKTDKKD